MKASEALEKIIDIENRLVRLNLNDTDYAMLVASLNDVKAFVREHREETPVQGDTAEAPKAEANMRFYDAVEVNQRAILSLNHDPQNFSLTVGPVTIDRLGTITVNGDAPQDQNAQEFLFSLAHAVGTFPFMYDNKVRYVQRTDLSGPRWRYETGKGNEEPLLKLFRFRHLDSPLGKLSQIFASLACWIVDTQPRSAERTLTLRALWDVKNLSVVNIVPDGEG